MAYHILTLRSRISPCVREDGLLFHPGHWEAKNRKMTLRSAALWPLFVLVVHILNLLLNLLLQLPVHFPQLFPQNFALIFELLFKSFKSYLIDFLELFLQGCPLTLDLLFNLCGALRVALPQLPFQGGSLPLQATLEVFKLPESHLALPLVLLPLLPEVLLERFELRYSRRIEFSDLDVTHQSVNHEIAPTAIHSAFTSNRANHEIATVFLDFQREIGNNAMAERMRNGSVDGNRQSGRKKYIDVADLRFKAGRTESTAVRVNLRQDASRGGLRQDGAHCLEEINAASRRLDFHPTASTGHLNVPPRRLRSNLIATLAEVNLPTCRLNHYWAGSSL